MKAALLVLFWNVCLVDGLSKFLDSYQTLSYHPVRSRAKRSTDGSVLPIKLHFASHNRSFRLSLKHIEDDFSVFARNLEVFENGIPINVNPRKFLVQGYDQSDNNSKVYGSILDGVFDGHIHYSNGESYTIDKVGRYLSSERKPPKFHSIIYSDEAINHPMFRRKRSIDSEVDHTCGLTKEVKQYMDRIQKSAVIDDEPAAEKVSKAFAFNRSFESYFDSLARKRRDGGKDTVKNINGKDIYDVRCCNVHLQVDQLLYKHLLERESKGDDSRAREAVSSLIYSHIKAVNHIYTNTDFSGIRGINFIVHRLSIFTPATCANGQAKDGEKKNPFCDENVDVSNFLNLNSKMDHTDFCLAYALTYRDFPEGTLGLAWVASPSQNTAGGICQPHTRVTEQSTSVQRSLNTGIITFLNHGTRVPPRVSQLTLAHEIGHNFGSPHDLPPECQPGLPNGNFIMFASATSGDKPNNALFSRCSIANISLVLAEVLQKRPQLSGSSARLGAGGRRNCFRESEAAFCGNGIKEPGEECDCGYTEEECKKMKDTCCYPKDSKMSGAGCKRRAGAQCSPSEGKCCNTKSCSFYLASDSEKCREESECLQEQFCGGGSAECPPSKTKPDGTRCQESTKVCNAGSCSGSVCAAVGLKDCFLTNRAPIDLCHLACEDKNRTCRSTFELPQFAAGKYNQTGRQGMPGLMLLPGAPCNNYKGYCDIFRKCRSVDADGPLARLKDVLFNPKMFEEVKSWIQSNWWTVALGGVLLMIFMAIFIKCCAVHTPSTNPNLVPARNFYETLRSSKRLVGSITRGRSSSQPTESRQRSHRNGGSDGERFRTASLDMPEDESFTNVVVVEPPPPYTESADQGGTVHGRHGDNGTRRPHKHGHRIREEVEVRITNVQS